MTQSLTFLADLKLGAYMKIPPRTLFMAQVSLIVIIFFVAESLLIFPHVNMQSCILTTAATNQTNPT